MVKNGRGQSGHRTLKLTLSQKLTDGRNWYFACLCEFKKGKSYFNDFWVGMTRNECGYLGHETFRSIASKNEFMNSADFLHVDCEEVIFG